ncbi:MAG: MaoC family dehydratase [Defluviitaleaceae bacterium]|nr:MaoC family dehydratase [Defluviitaleaceae bacterium]
MIDKIDGINNFSYEEIFIGQTCELITNISEQMQQMFHYISGDINPLHTDESYAKKRGFNKRVVYGMLTATFYSTLVGTLLPGKSCLFHEADIKFRNPVYLGDSLKIVGQCIEKNDLYKIITIKAKIYNQDNIVVSSAKLKVGVAHE